jgi:hypothetical protein
MLDWPLISDYISNTKFKIKFYECNVKQLET